MFRELGADGVVIGILTPEGELDVERMRELVKEAEGMSVTLHRAFDMCIAPQEALEEAVALGIRTILTSGQRNSAAEGADLLELLVELADNRITIMPGAGVSPENLPLLIEQTKAKAFHMTGKKVTEGRMRYRQPQVSMGSAQMDEYKINILGERIGMGDSMMMKDIHCWCTRQNIRYRTKFKYRKDYPILANIWNLYSYCRFRCDLKR